MLNNEESFSYKIKSRCVYLLHVNKRVFPKQYLFFIFAWVFSSCFSLSYGEESSLQTYQVSEVVDGLKAPWSMVPIRQPSASSHGEWLITERDGHVVHTNDTPEGLMVKRYKLPIDNLYVAGQGGLLDIILAPSFNVDGKVFVSFSEGVKSNNKLSVAELIFNGDGFSKINRIFSVFDKKNTAVHHSGRLLLLPDNTLLITSGDGYDFRERAQQLESHMGKILRINLDGSVPADNPFATSDNEQQRKIYSYGHRNPQGLVQDPISGVVFNHEHGPKGGDEVNIIESGENYGWPLATFGLDYTGGKITPYTEFEGTVAPVVNWTPSNAPSGMAYYYVDEGGEFPELQHHLLVTTLVDEKLYALDTKNTFKQQHIFSDVGGRLRDVYVLDDGKLAVLTDAKYNPAKLLLIESK